MRRPLDTSAGRRQVAGAARAGGGAVVCALALVLSGCGMLSFSSGDDQGYLLRSEEGGPGAGALYVTYEPGGQTGTITGYLHFAYPAENPEGAYLETQRMEGSVDGANIQIRLEANSQAEYVGTVEGGAMELRNGLASWEGEAATFGDFGEAAEEMAKASEEGNFAD